MGASYKRPPSPVTVAMLKGVIYGWTYSNNGADAVNDIDIAAGGGADSTGAVFFSTGALTKQLDVAWAVGTNQGGRLGGVIADTDYNIWAIYRGDTGAGEIAYEAVSASTPTLPASYTHYRKIGWFKRVAGTIVAFTTSEIAGGGIQLLWKAPTLDVDLANTLTTTRRTDAVKVPLQFAVDAILTLYVYDATTSAYFLICCPDETDVAPSPTAARLATGQTVTANVWSGQITVRTSAAGLIAARADLATVDTYRVSTNGFEWSRR